jgi:DNA primase
MEIPEIKQRLNILTVLDYYHLRMDRNNMLRCPFHEDEKPSLKVYPDTNTFHCFGCGRSGVNWYRSRTSWRSRSFRKTPFITLTAGN